jgi:hypothetical protein
VHGLTSSTIWTRNGMKLMIDGKSLVKLPQSDAVTISLYRHPDSLLAKDSAASVGISARCAQEGRNNKNATYVYDFTLGEGQHVTILPPNLSAQSSASVKRGHRNGKWMSELSELLGNQASKNLRQTELKQKTVVLTNISSRQKTVPDSNGVVYSYLLADKEAEVTIRYTHPPKGT